MKTLITLLALSLSLSVISQETPNDIVLNAAKSKLGTRVKTGICFDLVDVCLKEVDSKWANRSDSKYIYGKRIKQKDIKPGDIVVYTNCRFKDGGFTMGHVAIVDFVTDEDKEHIQILEQNTMKSLKKSIVVESDVDLSKDNLVSGKLEFFRPY